MVFFRHIFLQAFQQAHLLAKPFAMVVSLVLMLTSSLAQAEYALNFQEPVTEVARDIFGLHMAIFYVCVIIFVVVFAFMFYSIFAHRKSKNFEPSQFSHSTSVEIVWTIIPFFILVGMAIPATKVLIDMEDTTKSDLTIKITGYQWKWGYEYLNSDVSFYSTLTTPRNQIDQFDKENAEKQGENYLIEVDNVLVVPAGRKVRALITANDVIHAWWIPAFGVKKDAIPGYINELWFNVDEDKTGIYRGQCAELCGKDHAFMPIVVKVVSGDDFDRWLAAGGKFEVAADLEEKTIQELAQSQLNVEADASTSGTVSEVTQAFVEAVVPSANAQEVLSKDSLMKTGEKVYATCSTCHGANGAGIPGVFPAVTDSPVVNGPVDAHIDIVMFGKPDSAMAAYANQLNDEQIAAVITYQRNSFGNNTGDVVLPADIKAKRN